MMLQRKLGENNAQKVLKVFENNKRHFGFVKVTAERLSQLTDLYSPSSMQYHGDVFSFRAGTWMIIIVCRTEWVEVTIMNPYDPKECFTATSLDQ